jgi:small-conductance mechanosensitive channel
MKSAFFIKLILLTALSGLYGPGAQSAMTISRDNEPVDAVVAKEDINAENRSNFEPASDNEPDQRKGISLGKKQEWRIFRPGKIVSAILVMIAGWLAMRYTTALMELLSERWPQYRLMIKGFIPIVRITGWTVLISFVIIGIFKPPIQSVIAFTASAGIAIGFASQDILKNIFGGIMIIFDKPFKVGDKIQIDSYYGEVISIGLRTVRIVTPDDSTISVPNSEIVSKSVSNANSGEPECQVVADFYFEPDLDIDKAQTLAVQCASISRYVYLNKPVSAVLKNEIHLGKSMIHMKLKAYVIDHRFEFPFMTDMTKTVLREFRKVGLIESETKAP